MHTVRKIRTIKAPVIKSDLDSAKVSEVFRTIREERHGKLVSRKEAETIIRTSKVGIAYDRLATRTSRRSSRTTRRSSTAKKK